MHGRSLGILEPPRGKSFFKKLNNLRHAFMKLGKRIYIKCSNMIQKIV